MKKRSLDVYDERDNNNEEEKLIRRRGGGGGALGRIFDQVGSVELGAKVIEGSDDEELSEDEAFNSDDNERYGDFFSKSAEIDLNEDSEISESEYVDVSTLFDEEPTSEQPIQVSKKTSKKLALLTPSNTEVSSDEASLPDSEDDSESQTDGEIAPENLKAILKVKSTGKRKRISERTEAFDEGEHMVAYKPGAIGKKKLALNDLLGAVEDEKNFGGLKKHLSILGKDNSGPVNAPLASRIQAGIDRKAARIETEKSISEWTPLVKKERQSESIDFADSQPEKINLSSNTLVGKFEPFTQMEKEINDVLESSGLTEKKQMELEELALNRLSKEELEQRRTELAKMRSLMFHQEKKQRKIAKIKSKTYRKIANKAAGKKDLSMEELTALDPERAKEERHRMEFERAKERMTLKHKNNGKWAKRMLGRKDRNPESQKALMEQLAKGSELRKKIEGFDSSDDQDSDVLEDPLKQGLAELQNMESEDEESPAGVFAMKFMQRGIETKKKETEQARLAAERELQGVSSEASENEESIGGRVVFSHKPTAAKRFFREQLANSANDDTEKDESKVEPLFKVDSFESWDEISKEEVHSLNSTEIKPVETQQKEWIEGDSSTFVKRSVKQIHKPFQRSSKMEKGYEKIAKTKKEMLSSENVNTENKIALPEFVENNESESDSNEIQGLKATEIMEMAFANDDIGADFAREKAQTEDADTGAEVEEEMPGWGSWSGPGISKKSKSRVVQKKAGIEKNQRKDRRLKHVIINEKRQKKTTKYLQQKLPSGFENREQYERTIATPLGKEWNTHIVHTNLIKPKVITKPGIAIKPLKKSAIK